MRRAWLRLNARFYRLLTFIYIMCIPMKDTLCRISIALLNDIWRLSAQVQRSAAFRRIAAVCGTALLSYRFVYLVWFTPLPVYLLDRLNLRPFFLPNIVCDRCNDFAFHFPVDNRNFCAVASGRSLNSVGIKDTAKGVRTADNVGQNDKDVPEGDLGEDVFLLILVATYHPHMDARQAIRKSWGNVTLYRGQRIKTLFMFGLHEDKNYNYQVLYGIIRVMYAV